MWSLIALTALALLAIAAGVAGRVWLRGAMRDGLPQTEGTVRAAGLRAGVRIERNEHGVPHIVAGDLDDLVFAQGFVTAQDRLWQMDMLRRHARGELAEVLGSSMVQHDRTQRYLQLRQNAERALPRMDAEERHYMERYAEGVNAAIAAASGHLPPEFRVLGYAPRAWTAEDSLLVGYAMAEDLSTTYPDKLNREAVAARLPADLVSDLYPVGSYRDHPPSQGMPDLTQPHEMLEIPLDESQAELRTPEHVHDLLGARAVLAQTVGRMGCETCASGSNNWAVSGTRSASGMPMVANDAHLSLTVPGAWYAVDLESGDFHATGVTLPGIPFVAIGHSAHVAWSITNGTADVQDLYVEQVQGNQFRGDDGAMHSLLRDREVVHVKRGMDVSFDVMSTHHGDAVTPLISPLYPHETRHVSLRWNVYDPQFASSPFARVDAAKSGAELVEALRNFGGPPLNIVWGDDSGHIGYQLIGKIPLRGGPHGESGLSPVPVNAGTYEWAGYIPYGEMPAVVDPRDGVLATANARITPDSYPYGVSLDWEAPYRNERIWQMLNDRTGLTPDDMTQMQNDTFSALDKTFAERIAYAVDHAKNPSKRARQAADLLRSWDGRITKDSAAANLAVAGRLALLPIVLKPLLGDDWQLYTWRERSYAMELMVEHMPARWLPAEYADWNELLTAALERGMKDGGAPQDVSKWVWGARHTLQLQHPVFGSSWWMRRVSGAASTGAQPMPGSGLTVRAFTGTHGASERFVTDLADVEHATLTLPMGESGNPVSAWFMDEWPAWYAGKPLPLPFHNADGHTHVLELEP